jgi:hypothetical protein
MTTPDQLKQVLALHLMWLHNEDAGQRANLTDANLSDAHLSCANLSDAHLSCADLRGADLTGAHLRGADLTGAYLSCANLTGADLRGAYLRGADLTGARGVLAIGPIGSRRDILYAVQHADVIMLKTGCFWGSLDEFVDQVKHVHAGTVYLRHYLAAVDLIKAYFEEEK